MKINLLINIDDFGISLKRDEAIYELLSTSKVKSASIMVNTATFNLSTKYRIFKLVENENNNISFGLHLNLTESYALTYNKDKYKELIESNKICFYSENGKMLGKKDFHSLVKLGKLDLGLIKEEIISQIQYFHTTLGFYPSHIDGHQHVHVIPDIANILSEIMSLFCIWKTRIPREFKYTKNSKNLVNHESVNNDFYDTIFENCDLAQDIYFNRSIDFCEYFLGIESMGKNLNYDKILSKVFEIKRIEEFKNNTECNEVIVELMVHPGLSVKDNERSFEVLYENEIESKTEVEKLIFEISKKEELKNRVKKLLFWDTWDSSEEREYEYTEVNKLVKQIADSKDFLDNKYADVQVINYFKLNNINKARRSTNDDVKNKINFKKSNILIIGEFTYGTGNNITANRIKKLIFSQYNILLKNINPYNNSLKDIEKQENENDKNSKIKSNENSDKLGYKNSLVSYLLNIFIEEYTSFKPSLVLGINLYRSGLMLNKIHGLKEDLILWNDYNSTNKEYNNLTMKLLNDIEIAPYSLLLAGTDANIFLEREYERKVILKNTKNAYSILSLNNSMLRKIKSALENDDENKAFQNSKIFKVIPQSVSIYNKELDKTESKYFLYNYIYTNYNISLDESNIITIFPSGIRKVKDPLFLVNQFKRIMKSNSKHIFMLVGAVLDKELYKKLKEEITDVFLNKQFFIINQIPSEDFIRLMQASDLMINSSINEGQSNCIMESMLMKIPVLARANEGNCDLICGNTEYESNKYCNKINTINNKSLIPVESDITDKVGFLFGNESEFYDSYFKILNKRIRTSSSSCKCSNDRKIIKTNGSEYYFNEYDDEIRNVIDNAHINILNNYSEGKERESYIEVFNKIIEISNKDVDFNFFSNKNISKKTDNYSFDSLFEESLNSVKIISPTVHPFSNENNDLFEKGIMNYLNDNFSEDSIIENNNKLKIIDIGCGYGVFSIIFIDSFFKHIYNNFNRYKDKISKRSQNAVNTIIIEELVLLDIDQFCIINSERNIRNYQKAINQYFSNDNELNIRISIEKITYIKSNLLDSLLTFDSAKYKNYFDFVLVNLPQSPSRKPMRADKYGGTTGSELYEKLFNQVGLIMKENSKLFYLLISICNNKYLESVLNKNNLNEKVLYTQSRTLNPEELEKIQKGLFDYWLELRDMKKAEFDVNFSTKEILYQVYLKLVEFSNNKDI